MQEAIKVIEAEIQKLREQIRSLETARDLLNKERDKNYGF